MSHILFEDIFDVREVNPDGKKFEGVNRLHCRGTTYDVDLVLDINSEVFDVKAGSRVTLALSNTLALDGSPDDGSYNPQTGPSLMDSYDYVTHGRLFNIEHVGGQNVALSASFGGLLFNLKGDQSQLDAFVSDMKFYLLMRK